MRGERHNFLRLHDIEAKGTRAENIAGCISIGSAAMYFFSMETFGQTPATLTFGVTAGTTGIIAAYCETRRVRAQDRILTEQANRMAEMENAYESDNGIEMIPPEEPPIPGFE